METRKLYYEDCMLSSFSARVLACTQGEKGYEVILDETAFFPEGGGQAGDTGTLGGVRVLDTHERGEDLIHFCDGPLEPGTEVTGTIDFDVAIPAQVLPEVEAEANGAIYQDIPFHVWTPSREELPTVHYRTKRALPWPVRIVEIPGYDICACCGTHVRRTGEIGLIKLFSAVSFRGGTRIEMACGRRALEILNSAYDQNKQVSQAFSARITETGEAARKMNELLAQEKYENVALRRKLMDFLAETYRGKGNALCFQENLDGAGLRELTEKIAGVCGGWAAVFSGKDGQGYSFCLGTLEGDLKPLCREMTEALHGRGGGKPSWQQGRVSADSGEIRAFFAGK